MLDISILDIYIYIYFLDIYLLTVGYPIDIANLEIGREVS